jgi:peptidoglycan L-alanyl-D-glutamate endopeptidase CwlK
MYLDRISLERIDKAHPQLRERLRNHFEYASGLVGGSYALRLTQVLRTIEEQNKLWEQGRTRLFDNNGKRLGIVTWAKGGNSYHNFGMAFDYCLLKDTDGNGTFEAVDWNEKRYSAEIVKYFKSVGWQWGGDFPDGKKDYPHFQMTLGYSVRDLLEKYSAGDFIDGTKYVKL